MSKKKKLNKARAVIEAEIVQPTRDVMNVAVIGGAAAAVVTALFYAYKRIKR